MKELSVNHLIGIKHITKQDIDLIFETADQFKEVINRPIKKVPSLRDVTIANIFFENSTRTKLSFELAQKRLSADVISFSAAQSSVKKGETLIDTVNNILSMKVDMVVMRHSSPGAAHFLSQNINASVVNAGDGAHEHPTQALLDSFTIREKLGDVGGKKIVIVGDILHSRVALSNIFALQMQGAEVQVCGPKTLIPKYIESLRDPNKWGVLGAYRSHIWRGLPKTNIDGLKQAKENEIAVKNGWISNEQIADEQYGSDYETNMQQRIKEAKKEKEINDIIRSGRNGNSGNK
jgi:aspartate carbamoyltransferase